jgi:triosephosphate isomerase
VVLVGVSLKMYFSHRQTIEWIEQVAKMVESAGSDGIEIFVLPGYLSIESALDRFEGTPVKVGAQDLAAEDSGAFTGEVSGRHLKELGVAFVEVGHSERRSLLAENDTVVAAKADAALRNGLVPILCVGEESPMSAEDAQTVVLAQILSALSSAPAGRVVVAYEPVWAIGAKNPASVGHIKAVCLAIRGLLDVEVNRYGSSVIYGGSAGPGLLTELGSGVDGVFLGRFAHDPVALSGIMQEAKVLALNVGVGLSGTAS